MKIVQINIVYGFGSTGRIVKELHEFLLSKNVDSQVFVSNSNEYNCFVHKIGNLFDRKIHAILSRVFGLQGYFSFFSTCKMLNKIKKTNPDIVILHNLHGNYINIKKLLKFLAKNNIITMVVLHDCWFFTGRCWYYSAKKCDGLSYGCKKCIKNYDGNPSWFFNRAEKMYNDKRSLFENIKNLYAVGVSKWVTNEASKSFFGSSSCKLDYLYNWIDLNMFKPNNSTKHNDRKKVLSVASVWNEYKGIFDIKKVAEQLKEIDFIIVGKQKYNLKFSENVKLIPNTNDINELVKIYQEADVFLNLSCQETFGKVTAEALACGLPIVAYNSTATKELVNEHCGLL